MQHSLGAARQTVGQLQRNKTQRFLFLIIRLTRALTGHSGCAVTHLSQERQLSYKKKLCLQIRNSHRRQPADFYQQDAT